MSDIRAIAYAIGRGAACAGMDSGQLLPNPFKQRDLMDKLGIKS